MSGFRDTTSMCSGHPNAFQPSGPFDDLFRYHENTFCISSPELTAKAKQ